MVSGRICWQLSGFVKTKQTREEANREAQEEKQQRQMTFSKMSSGVYLVVIKGAKHISFSDAPLVAPERYSDIARRK